jgi:N-acetylmuramoyl-L-alanine amidase
MRIICRFYRNFPAAQCKNSPTLKVTHAAVALLLFTESINAALSPLAPQPDWSKLDAFQETITRQDFVSLLDRVYAPGGVWKETIAIRDDAAVIATRPGQPPFVLRFAPSNELVKSIPAYWRARARLPAEEPGKPLLGLRIALDPGHIGGYWARMEERWFQIGDLPPVTEGDMTLAVAEILVPRLESLGAQVFLTREKPIPSTSLSPSQLRDAAGASLADKGAPADEESLRKESERLFYRVAEIRRRAKRINEIIRPDVVVCLHFNAEPWGDATKPQLVDQNHLHFLVAGALSRQELAYEDQRYDMLVKLLNRSFLEELALTNVMSQKMAAATGLPPYFYRDGTAIRVNANPYVWARNLLANRLFACPVVYIEPYVMNSRLVFARIQAGDYEGRRDFGGAMRKSIYREYADAVAEGIVAYYSRRSP